LGQLFILFSRLFSKNRKTRKAKRKTAYSDLIEWFFAESGFELLDDSSDEEYERILCYYCHRNFNQKYQPELPKDDKLFMKEFILWALVEYKKL
jgi:magnesium chelatase subunit I